MYRIEWEKYLSHERFRKEAEDGKDYCYCFEQDLRRVVFCPAIRRMHDKTQVIPLSNGDMQLTRLTHSVQVMDVAEMLANRLTHNEEFIKMYQENAMAFSHSISTVLRAAALIHDIGNPPFGHFGEVTIQNYFKRYLKSRHIITDEQSLDFTEFDGNALGLRIVSKLQYTGTLDGLNLTYATLGAYLKYPNAGKCIGDEGYVGCHKHGVFKSEEDLFKEIVSKCNMEAKGKGYKRHPLSFLVEAADSICYGIMDVEDAYNLGWCDFDTIVDYLNSYIEKKVEDKGILKGFLKDGKFSIEKLIGFSRTWSHEGKEFRKDRRRLIVDFREKVIDYLVDFTVECFKENLEGIDNGSFDDEILRKDKFIVSKALGAFAKRYIISRREVQQTELTGNSVITGLLDILLRYSFHEDKNHRAKINAVIAASRFEEMVHENEFKRYPLNGFIWEIDPWDSDIEKFSPYAKLRVIVDFVGSMTDKYSVELYQRLSGMKL